MNKCRLLSLLVLLAHPLLSFSNEREAASTASVSANRIPIEVREKHPPRLLVNVDGIDVQLQFDLGDSTALVLQKSVLEAIKAVPTGESAKLRGVDGIFEAPLYKVKRVRIGTAMFTDVIARLDAARKGYEPHSKERGFLGTGLLKSYQLVIDYPQRAMTLMSPTHASSSANCQGTSVSFLPQFGGEPVTNVDTDLGPAILWWDTGAPVSVLRKTFGQQAGSGPSNDSFTSKRLAIGGVDFGPWNFERWDIDLPKFDGFIGVEFFARHVVCVDFPASRLLVGP
ncbi:MAG: hypothetical protein ABW110_02910 [Steroidobacteraceae bacterium]